MTDYERGYEQGKVDATKKMHPEIRKCLEDYFDKCFKEYQEHVCPWVGLAQPEQEPVAWGVFDGPNLHDMFFAEEEAQDLARLKGDGSVVKPLYAAPRQWVGLTDEERSELWWNTDMNDMPEHDYGKAIEAQLKEKNT